jgi:hypothetical protein
MLENQTEIIRLKSSLVRYFEAENSLEIVQILRASRPTSLEINYESWHGGIYIYALLFELEIKDFQRFKPILDQVKDEILTAVGLFTQSAGNEYIGEVRFAPLLSQYLDWNSLDGITTKEELLQLIDILKSVMISVSTNEARINTREDEYKSSYTKLYNYLLKLGADNPNTFKSLWEWHDRWSKDDLGTYTSRRTFIANLYKPLIDLIENASGDALTIDYEPTGWDRVDRAVYEMKRRFAVAETEEQFQAIGMLGRETLISTAQQVYDKSRHRTDDDTEPSKTDAKRMLDSYLSKEIAGRTNECLRKFAKSAVDMANELTHDRTAMKRDAALSLVSITAVTSLIKLIEASREPDNVTVDDIPF